MARDDDWTLKFEGFDAGNQGLREALCTLGNGYFATRGAGEEATADEINYPGTYLAGGYNRLKTQIAGRTIENEDLVNFPNWLPLSFRAADGEWLNLNAAEILDYRLALDIANGVLERSLRYADKQGRRTRLLSRRLVHMKERHLAAISLEIVAENWSGPAEVRSALDGRIINAGVPRYQQLSCTHLVPVAQSTDADGCLSLTVQTNQSGLVVSLAARTRLLLDQGAGEAACSRQAEEGYVSETRAIVLAQGIPVRIEKIVSLHTSRDTAISEPSLAALRAVTSAPDFAALERSQRRTWEGLWQRSEITIRNAHLQHATKLLRFHTFQLLQTLSPNSIDLDVGAPARGLHGEAYRGHVFWDELFVFPFYNARCPGITRSLLRYRYRRLAEARRLAREAGFSGAMFPWQSGSSGREESQRVHLNPKSGRWLEDNTHLQRHVTAAVAYNVWQHYQATGDQHFLTDFGAELLVEIARFWASIATWNTEKERFEIRGVMGPDEYHDSYPGREQAGIDNNAYTNIMAAWCIATTLECLDELAPGARDDLCANLDLAPGEIANWQTVSTRIFVPFHEDGIISQFEGYDDLEEFDWDGYKDKYGDIQRLDRLLEAEGDTPNRYKLSKQADVLMLFYLFSAEELSTILHRLGYAFDTQSIPKIIDYYLKRTSHGSSLSRVVHSWVLARSDRERSWQLFLEALEADIGDQQHGTTSEGIHLGAMAATIDLIERCYSGREIRQGCLRLNPRLPAQIESLSFHVAYQGNWLKVTAERTEASISAGTHTRRSIRLAVGENQHEIGPGQTIYVPYE